MSNTQRTPQQFKPGDRVRVGAAVENDTQDSHLSVKEGAVGLIVRSHEDGSWKVRFEFGDPLVDGSADDYWWWIDPRRLTLVDEKPVEPVEPAMPIKARDMTLHDWFAGQALEGMLASNFMREECGFTPKQRADHAHQYAAAMMERRAK